MEAKYIACICAVQEAIWLHQLLEQLGVEQISTMSLYGDNQGAITLVKNPIAHPCMKHFKL